MSSSWMVVAWRRALLLGITALTALLVVSFSAPADANAYPRSITSSYVGWAELQSGPITCTGVWPRTSCHPAPATAWRWSGSWSQVTLSAGTDVYAYPYASGWHWIWTQRTGWLAIRTSAIVRDVQCGVSYAVPCPR